MSLQFSTNSSSFTESGTTTASVSFTGTVLSANVALQGFDATYGTSDDHEIQRCQAQITSVSFSGNTVTYTVNFSFLDRSDNHMSGTVDALIIAETA